MADKNKSQVYCENFAETIISEVTQLIEAERKEHGNLFVDGANLMVLGGIVGTMVYNKLHQIASEEEANILGMMDDNKVVEYQKFKLLIQDAISSGFEHAFKAYMDKDVTYNTEILPLKDPSKMLN